MRKKIKVTTSLRLIKYLLVKTVETKFYQNTVVTEEPQCSVTVVYITGKQSK